MTFGIEQGDEISEYKSINKLFNILNEIINRKDRLTIRITNLSNKLLVTLKIIKNCTNCKDKVEGFHGSINRIENLLVELGKEEQEKEKEKIIHLLNNELNKL